jgi:hypothetical protein
MKIEYDDRALRSIAEALNHPEGGAQYQAAKTQLNYQQLKGQIEATNAQWEAIEVQRESIALQQAAMEVQNAAAAAEAKAADASVIGAKAAERNARWM